MGVLRKTAATVAVVLLLLAAEPASAFWGIKSPIQWPMAIDKPTWPPFKWPPHFPKPCFLDCWQRLMADVKKKHVHANYFVAINYCRDACDNWVDMDGSHNP